MKKALVIALMLCSGTYVSLAQQSARSPAGVTAKKKPAAKKTTPKQEPPAPKPKEDNGEPTPEALATDNMKLAQNMFHLNSDQFAAIYKAELEYCRWEQGARNSQAMNKKAIDEAVAKKDSKYKAVLTAGQYEKYYHIAHPESAAEHKQ